MYQYQKTNRYFAQTAEGLEELFAEEAEKLGAEDIEKAFKGVFFTCGAETLYKINYFTRIATRIVAPLISFDCHSTRYLYNTVSKIDFNDFMGLHDTFAVFANVAGSIINHSQYAALCVKDAIVDQFRKKYGERPDVNPKTPDIWFHILINNNKAVLSLETSGGSLHRRGYRKNAVEAPMMENVAAAVIDLSGWDGEKPLVDPMCGSGTVLAEALIKHCNIPAGYLRKNFGFMYMPDFDSSVWENIKKSAEEDIKPLNKNLISGYDIDAAAVKFARQNLAALPNGQKVKIQNSDFRDLELQNKTIITNPPYGKRIGKNLKMEDFVKQMGDFLKQNCKDSRAYIYFGRRELIKSVGLRTTRKIPLRNANLDGRLAVYEIY